MTEVKPHPLTDTFAFRLGTIGAVVADRYAARLDRLDLKLKHVGLMTALASGASGSQLDLARLLGVAPSLVVLLSDHLTDLGAMEKTRDPADRRRQVLTLTDRGRELLAECAAEARLLDAELVTALAAPERDQLHRSLGVLGGRMGLPIAE
ncbi:MarR family winged helix-turn-helix transcriptional regulator [Longispora sp. K20-0274]|uniref:MarR family winged helix-turn-helix transcriptional regulator n=1 Tax=Longispora sp. K20-0274 TaxID=3088255 RepID=UPI00399B6CA6